MAVVGGFDIPSRIKLLLGCMAMLGAGQCLAVCDPTPGVPGEDVALTFEHVGKALPLG